MTERADGRTGDAPHARRVWTRLLASSAAAFTTAALVTGDASGRTPTARVDDAGASRADLVMVWPLRGAHEIGCTKGNPSPGRISPCEAPYHPVEAIDIDAARGDPIHAAAIGTVHRVRVGEDGNCDPEQFASSVDCPPGSRGNYVIIEHDDGAGSVIYSYYLHLSEVSPLLTDADGATRRIAVSPETIIGRAGDSGYATPGYVHLHFEVAPTPQFFTAASQFVPLRACSAGRWVHYPFDLGGTDWSKIPRDTIAIHDGGDCDDRLEVAAT